MEKKSNFDLQKLSGKNSRSMSSADCKYLYSLYEEFFSKGLDNEEVKNLITEQEYAKIKRLSIDYSKKINILEKLRKEAGDDFAAVLESVFKNMVFLFNGFKAQELTENYGKETIFEIAYFLECLSKDCVENCYDGIWLGVQMKKYRITNKESKSIVDIFNDNRIEFKLNYLLNKK